MSPQRYDNPQSFKAALEQRLRNDSLDGSAFARRRQLLVFDRFLARLSAVVGDKVIVKGGLVVEIRVERARTTKDIDLRFTAAPESVLFTLQEVGRRDLGDFMSFEVQPDAGHPAIAGDSVRYEGVRFRCTCRLAGKLYGQPFGVDVAFGDPIIGETEVVQLDDALAFAGIAPARVQIYPVATHIAEKLHAYTLPRRELNSRVKDLPDIALLATAASLEGAQLRKAIVTTFHFRHTHEPPTALPPPPEAWRAPYAAMARRDALRWTTLEDVWTAAASFCDPVLRGDETGTWDPALGRWNHRPTSR